MGSEKKQTRNLVKAKQKKGGIGINIPIHMDTTELEFAIEKVSHLLDLLKEMNQILGSLGGDAYNFNEFSINMAVAVSNISRQDEKSVELSTYVSSVDSSRASNSSCESK